MLSSTMTPKKILETMVDGKVYLHRLTIPDAIVAVLILSVSVAVIAHSAIDSSSPAAAPAEAFIYHDGQVVRQLSLFENRQIALNDGRMGIEIKNGRIRISRSDCPRQFCVHQGWAEKAGEAIICVPFKYLIEIHSAAGSKLDAVVY